MLHSHGKHLRRPNRRKTARRLCLFLAALTLCIGLPVWGMGAKAASTPTSLGLAQHGINAYNEGWKYSYGGKGETVNGVRVSDCAGLIYAYFSDLGVGGCMGGATAQATQNCIFSGNLQDGIPNIHGLALTIFETDDPADGYSHIGIYIGNKESCENSDYGVDMVRASIYNRSWTSWHLFDNGVRYPKTGWYEFDGKMVHYTNYQYDTNTQVDGYSIGSDGFATLANGDIAPVDSSMLSTEFVPATEVRDYLSQNGWSGTDDPNQGGSDFEYNAEITADHVNLRSEPNTKSSVVAVLSKGTKLQAGPAVEGEMVSILGIWMGDPNHVGDPNYGGYCAEVFMEWYPVTTARGQSGYVSAAYVDIILASPVITCDGELVTISTGIEGDDIYYTTDGSVPALDNPSTVPYVSPVAQLGCTYKARVIMGLDRGPIATATVLSNGKVFTDFTYADWFAPMVDKAVALGVFSGNGDGTFTPYQSITRAQFVKVLANLSGEDLGSYDFNETYPAFRDVPENAYYYHHLAWAVQNGIISPSSSGKFNPNGVLPREQMCTMLDRYLTNVLGITDVDTSSVETFADDEKVSSWARDAVYRMRALGIVNGEGGNRFNPLGSTQRCAASKVAVIFHEKLIQPNTNPD